MNRKRMIWFIVIVALAAGGWYGYKQYTRTNKDLASVKADYSLSAALLVKEFETNDSAANKKYLGRVVEVDGNIKEIVKDESGFFTIVLGDAESLASVRCSIDTVYRENAARLSAGSSVTIRGACTGFNKDELGLGSDVILNRCAIIKKE
jgi:hypothetical protein